MSELKGLLRLAEEIGSKYQSQEEVEAHQEAIRAALDEGSDEFKELLAMVADEEGLEPL